MDLRLCPGHQSMRKLQKDWTKLFRALPLAPDTLDRYRLYKRFSKEENVGLVFILQLYVALSVHGLSGSSGPTFMSGAPIDPQAPKTKKQNCVQPHMLCSGLGMTSSEGNRYVTSGAIYVNLFLSTRPKLHAWRTISSIPASDRS